MVISEVENGNKSRDVWVEDVIHCALFIWLRFLSDFARPLYCLQREFLSGQALHSTDPLKKRLRLSISFSSFFVNRTTLHATEIKERGFLRELVNGQIRIAVKYSFRFLLTRTLLFNFC